MAVVTKCKKITVPNTIKLYLSNNVVFNVALYTNKTTVLYYEDFNSLEIVFDLLDEVTYGDFFNIIYPILETSAGKSIEIVSTTNVSMVKATNFIVQSHPATLAPPAGGFPRKRFKILITNTVYHNFESIATNVETLDIPRSSNVNSEMTFSGTSAVTQVKVNNESITTGFSGVMNVKTYLKYAVAVEQQDVQTWFRNYQPFLPKIVLTLELASSSILIEKLKQPITNFQVKCKLPDHLGAVTTNNHIAYGSYTPFFEITNNFATITLEDYYKFYLNI